MLHFKNDLHLMYCTKIIYCLFKHSYWSV